jgi:hypothetical protein
LLGLEGHIIIGNKKEGFRAKINMKKMNNILKMISQMDANANEIKLAKHEVNLSTVQTIIDYSIKANKILFNPKNKYDHNAFKSN